MFKPSVDKISRVSLFHDSNLVTYPLDPPFDPSSHFPENPSSGHYRKEQNRVYDAVRWTLENLGLDKVNQGTPEWNPLKDLVRAGGTVVIKPNLVDLKQGWVALGGEKILDMVTHGSVIRPMVDYAFKAVGRTGKIVIGDAPLVHADFEGVVEGAGIRSMSTELIARGYPLVLMDFREEFFARWSAEYQKLPGDPLGNSVLDLGKRSALDPIDAIPPNQPSRYFTLADHTDERAVPQKHHYKGKHEFCVPNTILSCDLFINMPKFKSHVKTGVTLSLKNLMGMTHFRRWMPHHRTGDPTVGGDEFPIDPGVVLRNREKLLHKISVIPGGKKFIRLGAYLKHGVYRMLGKKDQTIIHGGWYGNDTLWRTLVDLNRCLFYGRPDGNWSIERRAYLSLVDGIIGGDGNGPVKPTTKPSGILALSHDVVAIDAVLTHVMGFDPDRVRLIQGAAYSKDPFWLGHAEFAKIDVASNHPNWKEINLEFKEPLGWYGYLKRSSKLTPAMLDRLSKMGPFVE